MLIMQKEHQSLYSHRIGLTIVQEYTDFKRLIDSLLVKNKETEWIGFKENYHSKEEIGERISALSNSAFLCYMPYGYIVFGVNDDTLKVVGTDFYQHARRSQICRP